MKRLFTMLLTFVLAYTLAMPVFAQEATGQEAAPKAQKKVQKEKKVKKAKKVKESKEKKGEEAPKQ